MSNGLAARLIAKFRHRLHAREHEADGRADGMSDDRFDERLTFAEILAAASLPELGGVPVEFYFRERLHTEDDSIERQDR